MPEKSIPDRSCTCPKRAVTAVRCCSTIKTGRFTDNGAVDCENAAYRGVDGNLSKQWSSARARVIADGFRGTSSR